jgi:antitoxin HigA-1
MRKKLDPIHPGEVLLQDFMKPLSLSAYRVARDLRVPPIRITEIIKGKRAITAETALLLAKYFGTSADLWIRLQGQYDLETTEPQLRDRIAQLAALRAKASLLTRGPRPQPTGTRC